MEINVKTKEDFGSIMMNVGKKGALYIFGAGKYGKIFGEFFNQTDILWGGYIDNDSTLWGKHLKGKEIYCLHEISKTNTYIVISLAKCIYVEKYFDIVKQIEDSWIDSEKIIVFGNDFYSLTADIIWYIKKPVDYLRKIMQLKDIYRGKRCFIIGNGPSLQIDDLEKTSKDITMSCNGIIQTYDVTSWRPTCYFFADPIFIKEHVQTFGEIQWLLSQCRIGFTNISNDVYDEYRDKFDNLYFVYERKEVKFSEKMEEVTYTRGSSIFGMIQIAVYMGIKEIYLLGVDHTFQKEMRNGKIVINKNIRNHMELINQVNHGLYQMDIISQEFETAKAYAESHGIKIYNATRGGKLEIFERVNFDDLFDVGS